MQRNQRSNCQHLLDHRKSKRVPEKHLLLLCGLHQSLWLWLTINYGKFWKRWEYQTTWPASWEACMQARKQQLEMDMEQQTGSKLGKEYIKAVYCYPAYLTFIWRVHHEKCWAGISNKLVSRFLGEISVISDMQMTPPLWQKVKNLKASWWKWKRRMKKLS